MAVCLSGQIARADETAAQPTNAVPTATEAVSRDPFWPVGYAPRAEVAAPVASTESEGPKTGLLINNLNPEQQAALSRKLHVSGIMKTGSEYLARLNNQLVGAGDEVTVDFEGQVLTLIVRSISKDSVQIEPKP